MSLQAPDTKEKISAAITYLTLGIWGLVWLLVSRKQYFDQKDYVRFHCMQSIFIGMLYMFIPQGVGILFSLIIQMISFIPSSGIVTHWLHSIHGIMQSGIHYGLLILIVYCVIICLYGKFTNIPWVSQLVNRMLR